MDDLGKRLNDVFADYVVRRDLARMPEMRRVRAFELTYMRVG